MDKHRDKYYIIDVYKEQQGPQYTPLWNILSCSLSHILGFFIHMAFKIYRTTERKENHFKFIFTTSTCFTNTYRFARQLLQTAHLCTKLGSSQEPLVSKHKLLTTKLCAFSLKLKCVWSNFNCLSSFTWIWLLEPVQTQLSFSTKIWEFCDDSFAKSKKMPLDIVFSFYWNNIWIQVKDCMVSPLLHIQLKKFIKIAVL